MLARGAPFLSSGPTNIKYLVAGNPDILDLIQMFAVDVIDQDEQVLEQLEAELTRVLCCRMIVLFEQLGSRKEQVAT